ncbi:hypothetical protein AALP_AA3G001400 [Arabis alpina]|uniref:Uncharacterized protein n=1 Tax=Arabis alpina TaxID=50452 RepID=A0A087H625_ARAAL|nr:hypothetical protein AALP_AA3G001400 [Arabis alpina]
MGSKQRKGESGATEEEGKEMITDKRFSSAHTDPRFRRIPRRESKVTIDSRFKGMLTDKRFAPASAPVDKRGKRRRGGVRKGSLKEFYRIDEEEEEKEKEKEESGDESESEKEIMDSKSEESSEEESKKSEKKLELKLASSSEDEEESDEEAEVSEEEEEEDTDDDNEASYEDDGPEIEEENIERIEKETHRLAIVNMDWRHVSAKDLYVVLNSFLPKDGRIVSVAVYPSEFGLQRMKEEETHGPAIDGDKKNEDDEEEEEEEEEDEDEINQKVRAYEISRLKYYHAVAVCDSSATADFLYKSCDGIEFERSSNKLDLRFIPDSVEFKHPPRDIATEAPAKYEGLDFQSRALQMSKVNLSWDEDEPHRIKTLNQKFNADQLAELEMKEFLASDSDESESDDDNNEEGISKSKEEKRKEKYRALFGSGDGDSDKDEDEDDNDQDMEVTFNTGLEDLSKKILQKKDEKSETVWEATQRKMQEKKRARKNNKKNDDSSSPDDDDDDDDYNIDRKAVNDDEDDDFFMEEPPRKKKKDEKTKKKQRLEEEVAEEERSRAELELLLADENAGDGNGLKGYNIKRKGKRVSKEIAEEKIPAPEDDPRFSAIITDPRYALDPTDPQFKRSATYARQIAQKRMDVTESHDEVEATTRKAKPGSESKKEKYELSSAIKSLKVKMQQKNSDKKNAENAVSSSTLSQRLKKKAKDLSEK